MCSGRSSSPRARGQGKIQEEAEHLGNLADTRLSARGLAQGIPGMADGLPVGEGGMFYR